MRKKEEEPIQLIQMNIFLHMKDSSITFLLVSYLLSSFLKKKTKKKIDGKFEMEPLTNII